MSELCTKRVELPKAVINPVVKKWDILGISQCRWIDSGKTFLTDESLHKNYPGRSDNHHTECVTILMSHDAER